MRRANELLEERLKAYPVVMAAPVVEETTPPVIEQPVERERTLVRAELGGVRLD